MFQRDGEDPLLNEILKAYSVVSVIRVLWALLVLNRRNRCLSQYDRFKLKIDDYAVYVALRIWMIEYKITAVQEMGNGVM